MSNADGYTVVRAGAEGIERIEKLWYSLVEFHREVIEGEWPVRTPEAAWERRRAQYEEWTADGTGTFLLAVPAEDPGGEPAGYAMVRVFAGGGASWDLGDEVGELETLAVDPAVRGAGIGTMLVRAAKEHLRDAGVAYWSVAVVEVNDGATRLYEREGFRPYYRSLLAKTDD